MSSLKSKELSRRAFFLTSTTAAVSVATAGQASVAAGENTEFQYEVQYSDEEWRARLTEREFDILRGGFTEPPKSSPLWEETRPGTYHCKGCELHVFDGRWKSILDKGWVFFFHAQPDSVLTNIDGPTPDYGSMSEGLKATMEIHCRRCGSHLGHFLIVEGRQRHCINGTSLTFRPAET